MRYPIANPQAEDGHTDIANDIMEALSKQMMSPDEWRCLMVILRKTYGWHKKRDWISLGQFSEMTGIYRQHVPRVLKRLIQRNIIIRGATQSGSTVTHSGNTLEITYGFQKDFERWGVLPNQVTATQPGSRGATRSGKRVLPGQVPTKETRQKKLDKRKVILSDDEFLSSLKEKFTWVDFDAEIVKIDAWFLVNPRRKKTRGFIVRCISKIEKPMQVGKTSW